MPPRDLQHETMRVYQSLTDSREDWGGGLVLCSGPGCAHPGVPVAVSIANGATLAIDADAAAMKSAMRAGYLDFVVNTLDEALRTLKNEIRQKRPLGVGVIAAPDVALAEMVDRGVQPDLQLIPLPAGMNEVLSNPSTKILVDRGMPQRLMKDGVNDRERPFMTLFGKRHYECFFRAAATSALRDIDAALLSALPVEDLVRRRWIERVPRYLREARSGGRWTWLNEEELASLAANGLSPERVP